ncbi:hypothetical protein WJX74_004937 [Apatococcus lobatus]|uniref:Uncharacterized protein n=1 Tax=Apatococcus lobatus TaxID=904363 RepID=A0AAW1Q7P3_9CHLO
MDTPSDVERNALETTGAALEKEKEASAKRQLEMVVKMLQREGTRLQAENASLRARQVDMAAQPPVQGALQSTLSATASNDGAIVSMPMSMHGPPSFVLAPQ